MKVVAGSGPARGLALTAGLALVACSEPGLHLELPPFDADVRAVLFVLERSGRLEVEAREWRLDRPLLRAEISPSDATRVFALGYRVPLQGLGLREGPVAIAAPDVCASAPLPAPDELRVAGLGPGVEAPAWAREVAPPPALAELRVPVPCPCSAFEVLSTADIEGVKLAARLNLRDGRALLIPTSSVAASVDPVAFVVEGRGVREVRLMGVAAGIRAVAEEADGRLLVAGRGVWRGRLDDRFTPVPGALGMAVVSALAGPTSVESRAVYGVTLTGEVLRIQGDEVEVVARLPAPSSGSLDRGLIARTGAERVAVGFRRAFEVFELDRSGPGPAVQVPAFTSGLTHLLATERAGLVAVTSGGILFGLSRGGLSTLGGDGDLAQVLDAVPFRGGLVFSGSAGYLQEFQATAGLCPTAESPGRRRQTDLAVLSSGGVEGLAAIGPVDGALDRLRVTVLAARPASP